MNLLPFEEFSLESTLPCDKVISILASFAWKKQHLQAAGIHFSRNEADGLIRFDVEPVSSHRSPFVPVINGIAKGIDNGCFLTISMGLPPATFAFLLALCTWFVVNMVLIIGNYTVDSGNAFSPKLGFLFSMGALGFAIICVLLFKREARRNRLAITKTLAKAEGN